MLTLAASSSSPSSTFCPFTSILSSLTSISSKTCLLELLIEILSALSSSSSPPPTTSSISLLFPPSPSFTDTSHLANTAPHPFSFPVLDPLCFSAFSLSVEKQELLQGSKQLNSAPNDLRASQIEIGKWTHLWFLCSAGCCCG